MAPSRLRMVPGIRMTGKLKEEEKEEEKKDVFSVEALDAVVGKPRVL